MKDIRLDLTTLSKVNNKHPQKAMDDLGINYESFSVYPIGDCWIFENCKNIPNKLPSYLTIS